MKQSLKLCLPTILLVVVLVLLLQSCSVSEVVCCMHTLFYVYVFYVSNYVNVIEDRDFYDGTKEIQM